MNCLSLDMHILENRSKTGQNRIQILLRIKHFLFAVLEEETNVVVYVGICESNFPGMPDFSLKADFSLFDFSKKNFF